MKNIYLIICLLFATSTHSQVLKKWQYDNAGAFNNEPTTNIVSNGLITYVCSQSLDTPNVAYLIKLDENGLLLAQDTIHNLYYPASNNKRMVADNAGNIYLSGNAVDVSFHSEIKVIKFDANLTRLWDFTYLDGDPAFYSVSGVLYSSLENSVYLVGEKFDTISQTIVMKFDTAGTIQWAHVDTLQYGLRPVTFSLDHTGDIIVGGFGVITNGISDDFFLLKFDTTGSIGYGVNINGTLDDIDFLHDFCVDPFNNVYATGNFIDTNGTFNRLMKFDTAGALIWSFEVNIGLHKITSDLAGNVYIATFDSVPDHEFTMLKFDSAGTMIHSNVCDIPSHMAFADNGFNSIYTNDSAQVYYLNSVDTGTTKRWLLAKSDSTLSLLWSFVYPDDSLAMYGLSSAICPIYDGFIVSGSIDSNLSVVRFQEESLTLGNSILTQRNISYWPNPVKDVLYFNSDETLNGKVDFTIYDMASRVVFSATKNIGEQNQFSFLTGSLSEGMYYFTLQSKSLIIGGKLIK